MGIVADISKTVARGVFDAFACDTGQSLGGQLGCDFLEWVLTWLQFPFDKVVCLRGLIHAEKFSPQVWQGLFLCGRGKNSP